MKKLLLVATVAVFGFTNVNAQTSTEFGVSAGYNSLIASAKVDGNSGSSSISGFFVGVFADIATSEKFHVQPELQYVNVSQNGGSGNMLVMPILGKYYVSNEFNLLFGPQLDFILDESEGVNTFGFGLSAGIGYDITEKFSASARYSFGLSNRLQDVPSGTKVNFNFFQLGLSYKF